MRVVQTLLILLFLSHLQANGLAAEPASRIVIRDVATSSMPAPVQGRVHAAVVEAIHTALLNMVPDGRLSDRLARCALPACLPEIKAATAATHVLDVNARLENEEYHIVIGLWDVASGRVAATERKDCLICDREDFIKAVGDRTQALLSRAFLPAGTAVPIDESASENIAPLPEVARRTTTEPGPALVFRPASPTKPAESRWRPVPLWTGASLGGLGLAMVGYGIHLWSVDGDPVCGPGDIVSCDLRRDTKQNGTLLVIGGIATAAVGGVLVWHARPSSTTMVGFGPGTMTVAGTF